MRLLSSPYTSCRAKHSQASSTYFEAKERRSGLIVTPFLPSLLRKEERRNFALRPYFFLLFKEKKYSLPRIALMMIRARTSVTSTKKNNTQKTCYMLVVRAVPRSWGEERGRKCMERY
jgi:hypothetical protein